MIKAGYFMLKIQKQLAAVWMMAGFFLLSGSVVYAQELPQTITGFTAFDIQENAMHINIAEKPSLDELLEEMPETLEVYLEEENEPETIEVDWYCVAEDYEESDNFYFQFSPVWDEEKYCLSEEVDLLTEAPYIAVFFTAEEEGVEPLAVTKNSNEEIIFEFLTKQCGYNVAAACGAMANLYCESAFIPVNLQNSFEKTLGYTDLTYTMAVDLGNYTNFVRDSAGYGLCQWTYYSRKQELLDFARSLGTSIGDIHMQLAFMKKELSGSSTDNYLKTTEDSAQGAYYAGYNYCDVFERPAQKVDEVSAYRGNLAKNTYWKEYAGRANYTIGISDQSLPGTIVQGNVFSVKGTVASQSVMTSLTAGIYNVNGKMVTGTTVAPNALSYDLKNVDKYIKFGSLQPGIYVYQVTAQNETEVRHLVGHTFMVLGKSKTISEGKYMLVPQVNTALATESANGSTEAGANVQLSNMSEAETQYFNVKYVGNGYYTLENCGTGKYLEAAGSAGSRINVRQNIKSGQMSQNWQIVPGGSVYYLIPQNMPAYAMEAEDGKSVAGTNLLMSAVSLSKSQKFKFSTYVEPSAFKDVKKNDWYFDYAEYVYEKGLMTGYEGLFTPNANVTRAMTVEILYRLAGSPKVTDDSACTLFSDVDPKGWYANSVCWAYNTGVTTGYVDIMKFGVDDPVTREQLATFLCRYSQLRGYDTSKIGDYSALLNADKVSPYAAETLKWAVGTGLISGVKIVDKNGNTTGMDLQPQGNATRAQMATILTRYCQEYGL